MYQQTDKFLKALKKKIRSEFNHLSVLAFDELNVVTIGNELKAMYKRLLEFNRKGYEQIVDEAHLYAISLLSDEEKEKEAKEEYDREDFIDYVLDTYNPVTGYLYEKEAERKRLRQSEEMATARVFLDRPRYRKTIQRSANLWFTQSMQYAIDIEDHTVLETIRKAGVKKVQWISEDDTKTCKLCKKLDGTVYDIDKVPPKVHYNCRCKVIPYKDILDFV